MYIHTYILESWNVLIIPWSRLTAISNKMCYHTNKTKFNKQEKIDTFMTEFYIQAPEFSLVLLVILHIKTRLYCSNYPATSVYSVLYPCTCYSAFQLSVLYFPVPRVFVILHSWPTGRRTVWLPRIQWHFSPHMAGFSLWGTFSCVCHFGRAKGRSVHENDCVLGDRK